MKNSPVLLCALIFIFLSDLSICSAEKIYYKNGRVLSGNIIRRGKGSVWIGHKFGSIGVNINSIDRIEDDNGRISRYDFKSLCRQAQHFIRQKNYKEAAEVYTLMLESLPNNTHIRYLRAVLNHKIGDLKNASEDYNFLIANNASDAIVFNNMGAICAARQEYAKAAEFFVKATEKNPDMAEAHNNLAEAALHLKDYDRAVEEYNKVIELEPQNIKAIYNLGVTYMNKNDYPKAKEQWEKILLLEPNDIDAKNALEGLKSIKQ